MNINGISNNDTKTAASVKSLADTSVFLRLLTTELCNQDPTNPTDSTQYISQLAQFTSLQQTEEINDSIKTLLLSKDLSSGTSMIGQEVLIRLDDATAISETVKSVRIYQGNVYLSTDSGYYSIDDVIGVGPTQIEEGE